MASRRDRGTLRRVLDERFVLVALLLALLVLLGGVATYATVADRSIDGATELDHRATVQAENPIYETDAELEDQTTYFTSISPELDGEFSAAYETDRSDELLVETEITMDVRWVPWEDTEPDREVLWNATRQLEAETVVVESGESVTVDFTVDVAEERDRIQTYRDEHGEVPGHPELIVVAETAVVDPNDGNSTLASDRETLSISLVDDVYTVDEEEPTAFAAIFGSEATGIFQLLGSIGLLLASLAALGGLVVARQRGMLAPDPDEAARNDFEHHRRAFDDWISRGRVPGDRLTGSGVRVASLADLVDVAIDSDRRVLEDTARGSYYVLVDETHYVYRPPVDTDETERTDSTRSDESSEPDDGSAAGPSRT